MALMAMLPPTVLAAPWKAIGGLTGEFGVVPDDGPALGAVVPTVPVGPTGAGLTGGMEIGDPGGTGAPVPIGGETGAEDAGTAGEELSGTAGDAGDPLAAGAEADGATVTVLMMVTGVQVGQVGQADALGTTGTEGAVTGDSGVVAELTTGTEEGATGDSGVVAEVATAGVEDTTGTDDTGEDDASTGDSGVVADVTAAGVVLTGTAL